MNKPQCFNLKKIPSFLGLPVGDLEDLSSEKTAVAGYFCDNLNAPSPGKRFLARQLRYASSHLDAPKLTDELIQKAFKHINEIQELITRDGGVFDPPAGQIRTNFQRQDDTSTDVFGYFYLTVQDTVRIFVEPEDIGVSLPKVCDATGPNGRALDICNDCLSARNSTAIKPAWWQ